MLLSINMIVKDEEKYLRDCLTAIKPILEQVHSELIIVDTGSTDNTVEIAKEFTDRVYHSEWKGDFAEARNQALKRSRGKWCMTLDADEIYQDVDDIIEFFNSGEYKKFGFATMQLENIKASSDMVSLFNPLRFFKMNKGVKWHGAIHEMPRPLSLPEKFIKSRALHYGYMFETEEEKIIKNERNLVPLLEMFEKDPEDTRNIFHIINQYAAVGDTKETDKYLDIAFECYKKKNRKKDILYHAIYFQLIEHLAVSHRYEEVIAKSRSYFENLEVLYESVFDIKFLEVLALISLKRHKEAGDATVLAIDLFEKKVSGNLNRDIKTIISLKNKIKERSELVKLIVLNYATAGEFDEAFRWYEQIKEDLMASIDIFNVFSSCAVQDEKAETLVNLYDYAVEHYEVNSVDYDNAVAAIERYIIDDSVKKTVAESFTEGRLISGFGDDYLHLWHLRKLILNNDPEVTDALKYFLEADKQFSHYYGDVFVAAIREKLDFSNFIKNMRITNSIEFVQNIIRSNKDLDSLILEYLNENNYLENAIEIKSLRLLSSIISMLINADAFGNKPQVSMDDTERILEVLRSELTGKSKEQFKLELFEAYARLRNKYLIMVYRDEIYTEGMVPSLPEQDGFAFYAGQAYAAKDKNDTVGFIKNLRLALTVLPHMKDLIEEIGNQLKEEQNAPTVHEQLSAETAKLKSIIYTMINTGNIEQAAQILESYTEINPTDPEIEKIRRMLA